MPDPMTYVSFADNYYQTAAPMFGLTATPNGREIAKFDYTVALSGDRDISLPARAGFTIDNLIGGTHSRVWRWYAGTANLGLDYFDSTAPKEQIVRAPIDLKEGGYFGGETWYRPRGFSFDRSDAPWEGIGTGWAFAPQGGGDRTSTWTVAERVQISEDNTEIPNAGQSAVPTIFDGNFEHGNLHRTARYPLLVGHDILGTPGWSFLGGDFSSNDSGIVTEINGLTLNHVVELSSLSNTFIRHNWFYVPDTAQSLDFDINIVQKNLQQTGRLEITAEVENIHQPVLIGSIALNGETNGYLRLSTPLPSVLRGKIATLKFELVAPGPVFGADRVRLDNIALTLSQPLQTEPTQTTGLGNQTLGENTLAQMLATAQAQWTGLINVPVGSTGFGLTLGSTAGANINQSESATGTPAKTDGSTGFSQGSLDNQSGFANTDLIDELAFGSEQIATFISTSTDQLRANRDAAFATDGHTIEAQLNAVLVTEIQHETITKIARHETAESDISDNRAFINGSSIVGIPYLDISLKSSPPGGNGSVSDLKVFDLQRLSLLSLQPGSDLVEVPGLEGPQVFAVLDIAAGLSQSKSQYKQQTGEHLSSLGLSSNTVPPDRNVVNRSVENGKWKMVNG